MRNFLLLLALASVAYSRPGETSGQIQQRFGAPLTEEAPLVKNPDAGKGHGRHPNFEHSGVIRPVSAPPLTASMREVSRVYRFGKIQVTVHFFDNQSQREEYKGGQAEIQKILSAASNGAPWAVELHDKGSTDVESSKERVFQNQGITDETTKGSYKSKGLRAWLEDGKLIVETDAFRALRLSEPAKKPEPQLGQPIPGKGKGF